MQRLLFVLMCVHALSLPSFARGDSAPGPNVLLIVADDLGYADLGVYGSDIRTPNIDALAGAGVLFTRFHTAPMCAPTRAMLLSGNNNHVAGMANQQREGILGHPFPGYEAGLSNHIAPLPRLLRDADYETYAVGKWHLGFSSEQSPTAAGFDRSWMMLDGAGTYFDGVGFENGPSTFWHDGEFVEYPTGNYATEWYTDRLIEFIDDGRHSGKPFFAYAAYTSPHWPLQVPDEYLDLYAGRYGVGYDALREQRFESAKKAGVVAPDSELPPRNPDISPWEALSEQQKRREAREMELYAALLENLDHHVGRLLDHLRATGLYDDTLIIFMSDNGAASEDFYNTGPFVDYLRAHFTDEYESMGTERSFVSYGPGWAEASSAPFSRYKTYALEGGVVAPMVIAGTGIKPVKRIDHGYVTVMDLAPTILEAAQVAYPADGSVAPLEGESLIPYLDGTRDYSHSAEYVAALYHRGVASLRQGPWKLVTREPPFDESKFELFDVVQDPGETKNLAAEQPDKYRALVELWRRERRRLGIVLPEDL